MEKTLKDLRIENGLTQKKLAMLLNVHRNHISKWENGNAEPEFEYIHKMSLVFKIPDDDVIKSLNRSKITEHTNSPNVIAFRCSDDLYNKIKQNADEANMKVSTYVARTYDGGNITVISGLKEFYRELNQVGKNLNQLTLLANKGAIKYPDLDNLRTTLTKIHIKIDDMLDRIS